MEKMNSIFFRITGILTGIAVLIICIIFFYFYIKLHPTYAKAALELFYSIFY